MWEATYLIIITSCSLGQHFNQVQLSGFIIFAIYWLKVRLHDYFHDRGLSS